MKIPKAIHRMLRQWDKKGFSPSAINCGNCDEFAWELAKKFPRGRALWGDDCRHYFTTNVNQEGHCFFKYGKKFYDSESPQGVFYPDELQYYRRSNKEDNEYWQKNRKQNRKCA